MTTPRRRNRPNFDGDTAAIWLDTNVLADQAKSQLLGLLPVKMSEAFKFEFIDRVSVAVQWFRRFKRTTPEGKQKEQLQAIAEQANRLLAYMGTSMFDQDTRGTVRAFGKDFLFSELQTPEITDASKAAVRANELAAFFWDTIRDVELVFSYAADQLQPTKQDRPSVNNSRVFVGEIAHIHFAVTGTWPPYSKGTWFTDFIDELATISGSAPIGKDTIKGAILEAKKVGLIHKESGSNGVSNN